jgi:PAS domain S-box-containing protein
VVLENDFRRPMAAAEIPAWHLPLTSFLGVPLKHGGVVVGMLALANKDGGYDASDQEAMETLATAFVAALLRKRAETAQRETKDLLHATLESTTDGILVTDESGTITQCNARFAQMFRFPVDFAQSWDKTRIFQHILDQVADPAAFRDDAKNLKQIQEILRGTLVLKDGRVYERVSSPLVRNGANAGGVHSLRDVTERVRAEARLRQKEEELRQSQKMEMVGQLAGGIAHEFNNLLQAIEGYTNYALDGLPPDQQRHQDLQQVLKASGRAATLTRQLLGFSRHQVLERKNIDPNQVVNELIAMLRPLIGAHIQVKTVLAEDAGVILADTGELEQALLNLCVNARDAMPSGGNLVLKTATRRLETEDIRHLRGRVKPGRYAVLTVADNGCGMSPETKRRIFEPFYTTKEVGKGTGLGLANVYGIVQQHGGTIEVESELGRGSTFEIYLPTVQERSNDEQGAAALPAVGGSETLPSAKDGGLAWATT